jgi:hypothetical protein
MPLDIKTGTSPVVLKFEDHHSRLGNIAWLVHFLDGAAQRLGNSLPNEPNFLKAREEIVTALNMLGESVEPPHQFDFEEIRSCLAKQATPTESSRSLVYSLCLVMLVTQVELFIGHLIDVILSAEPRRLKDLAGDKQLNSRDLVDAQNYETVMARLREKVAKEVIGSSIREMLEKHLGERFNLFKRESLACATIKESGEQETWGISEIEAVWNTRHEVVHEGRLDLNQDDFERALFCCTWIETFLSIRAQEVYDLAVDSPPKLKMYASLYNKVQPYVLFTLQVGWMASAFLSKLTVKK